MMIQTDNFNQLFLEAIFNIRYFGKWTYPRGFICKEIIASQLILTNPKNCLCTIKDRKMNYAYLIVEKMMYLSGVQYPDILIAYNGKMKDFLNTGTGLFDGAYGPRIAQGHQLEYCYNILKSDKESRQATITINNYTDRHKSKDIPCTMSFDFLIRDNKLNMIATMRSNDLLWGTCLDIPAFCFIQEVIAYWLGVEAGQFVLQPGSLHYYDNFEKKLDSILKMEKQNDYEINNFNSINDEITPEWNIPYALTDYALRIFWKEEKNIRNNLKYNKTNFDVLNQYLDRLLKYWINKSKK